MTICSPFEHAFLANVAMPASPGINAAPKVLLNLVEFITINPPGLVIQHLNTHYLESSSFQGKTRGFELMRFSGMDNYSYADNYVTTQNVT